MIVLLDLEWIDGKKKHFTQLAAIRVDSSWNVVSEFNEYMNPGKEMLKLSDHVAFGNNDMDLFAHGLSEKVCIRKFEDWLLPDDIIWVWTGISKALIADLWYQYAKKLRPAILSVSQFIRDIILWDSPSQNPYGMLAFLGEDTPEPEHRSTADVETLRRLMKTLEITGKRLFDVKTNTLEIRPSRKEINRKHIEGAEYNYIYLKNSSTFHRRSCPNWQNALNDSDICGSVYFRTAAKYRQPCKFCKPKPLPEEVSGDNATEVIEPKPCLGTPYKSIWDSNSPQADTIANEVTKARLITGQLIDLKRGKIVGWCHNPTHPGTIDKRICMSHDCLGKGCFYFKQNPLSFYISDIETRKKTKELRKQQLQREKQKKSEETCKMKQIRDTWQDFLDDRESDMEIVRVEKASPYEYRVFYVSDNRFADGHLYPDFLDKIRMDQPRWRIILRHIRDLDGHFVTRNEFAARHYK